MSKRLDKKTAMVTAAAAGIGRASALAFAREGADVWATDIDAKALDGLHAENPQIRCLPLDVTDSSAVRRLVNEIGHVDVLFNCAGIRTQRRHTGLRGNRLGLLVRSQRQVLLPDYPGGRARHVEQRRRLDHQYVIGRIQHQRRAETVCLRRHKGSRYRADAGGCRRLCPTRHPLQRNLPGTVDTPSLQQRLNAFPDPARARKDFERRQAMGRLGSADEIAALAVYLASDESSYTTGVAHIIDGGWTI